MAAGTYSQAVNTSPYYSVQLRKFGAVALVSMIAIIFATVYLMPFGNMLIVALESRDQLATTASGVVLPVEPITYTYPPGGTSCQKDQCSIYNVPQADGTTKQWALVNAHRQNSDFIDPANPSAGLITWQGQWRTLDQVTALKPHPENFVTAWNEINFPLLFRNTLVIALTGMIGTLLSSICVAYAFARFPIPGKNILFLVLIGTIIIPQQVTLIPTYAFFARIGWTGTWLPLIVPHFFANAYNVFLLRQYFMTLPRQLDEAAMIDGASPLQVLLQVIIPQSWPVIVAVGMFHFVFAWNDYFGPLIYLLGKPDFQPISVGVQVFNFAYGAHPELVQATSLLAMALPVLMFFLAQRFFMRGVVITGVEK
ncbi:MAG TPA: carbohydrate ABC transporter permease [Aggregatilineales bacterium]|nr:carbohydrate ABC transporter permease [Aggregatilineales bacterium]